MKNFKKGFTLIELLIVIALLGSLAVGMLAALDPFEQLKKGADTGVRNTVSEIHGAIIRYYAIKNAFPWLDTAIPDGILMNSSAGTTIIDNIVATGELKADFKTLGATQLPLIYLKGDNTNAIVTVCYKPTAKSFQADPNTKSDSKGLAGTTCISAGGANSCYWCVK